MRSEADVDRNLAARKADYEKAANAYHQLIASNTEHELVNQLDRQWQDFIAAAEEVRSLAGKGDLAAARQIKAKKVVPVGRSMDKTLAGLVELNDQGAGAAGESVATTYWRAVYLMSAMLFGALALGISAAVFVSQDIRRGINSILVPMGRWRISSRNSSAPGNHRGRPYRGGASGF